MKERALFVRFALSLGAVAGGLACRGTGPAPGPATLQSFEDKPGAVQPYLGSWRVLGPLAWDPGPQGDKLTDLTPILDRPLVPVEARVISGEIELSGVAGQSTQTVNEANGEIKLHALFPRYENQAALAAADVSSPVATDAALLVESDDAVRVWLNGAPVHTSATVRRIQQFENYARVPLRKGANRIVVKLVRTGKRGGSWDSWSFALGLRSLRGARDEKGARTFIQEVTTSVVGKDGKLDVDLRLHEAGQEIEVAVQDHLHQPVKQFRLRGGERHRADVGDLPEGLYYSLVARSAAPEPFPFYKGEVAPAFQRLVTETAALRADPTQEANLAALEQRFAHLQTPEHRENQNHLRQAKVAQLLSELTTIRDAVRAGRAPFQDVPGTHLRGIRSRLDGANQYYLLHVPRGYRRAAGPIPLVLFQPYKFETLRPFLESTPVAEIAVLGTLARMADENGLAFLWMDNRGNTVGSDFGETDMFDAVDQVARDYAIDRERLYLFGSCAGGREALSLAAKYPDRFAAVGTMSPTSTYQPYAPNGPSDPFGKLAYSQKTPLERLENLSNVPVYAFHGDQNTHNPLSESLQLKEAAGRAGVDFNLDVVRGATHLRFPVEPRSLIFRWFAGRRRVTNPDRVVFTTSAMRYHKAHWVEIERFVDAGSEAWIEARYHDGEIAVDTRNVAAYRLLAAPLRAKTTRLVVKTNGAQSFSGPLADRSDIRVVVPQEQGRDQGVGSLLRKTPSVGGPVWDVFTAPFQVVVGTGGGGASAQAAQADAERFVESWHKRFLGTLAVKTDRETTADDIRDRHLVLFGEVDGGGPLGPLAGRLPFRTEGNHLNGPGGIRHVGPVAAQYVFPNPINPQRYLLVTANPAGVPVPVDSIQVTVKGWYDYAIWRRAPAGQPLLEDAGMFDPSWSRLVSKTPWSSRQAWLRAQPQ